LSETPSVTSSTPHSVTSSEVEKSTATGLDSARPDSKVASSTSANIIEIKADKQPSGKTDNPKPFTTHEIELKPGMQFYLFTDGFADQFGGPKGKKFKYQQLEELLLSLSNSTMQNQKETLISNFSQWKGDLEQVDDVCVIGLRV
jgi:serine phosphatase RsbU (regulator of sigma subunit)